MVKFIRIFQILIFSFLILAFQNCGEPFQSRVFSKNNGSSDNPPLADAENTTPDEENTLPPFIPPSPPKLDVCNPSLDLRPVSIDLNIKYQKIDGFGSTVRLFNDPHVTETFDPLTKRAAVIVPAAAQKEILSRLYQDIGLSFIRPATESKVELINDNNDPNSIDFSAFDFSFKNGDGYIDYVKRASPLGGTQHFLSPIYLETWIDESMVDEYAEWAIANLIYWRNQGLEPKYYSIINEPSYSRGRIWSPEFIRDAVKAVGKKLIINGFNETKLIVPDDVRASDAARILKVVLADPEARKYIGALATHLYDESTSNLLELKMLSQKYSIPLWMTEFSMYAMPTARRGPGTYLSWAKLMHDLLAEYEVSNILYMWGYFGQWEQKESSLITINNMGNQYLGYSLNKSYYSFGQFSKFVRPGFVRINANYPQTGGLNVSAYNLNNKSVFVIVNEGESKNISLLTVERPITSIGQSQVTSSSQSLDSVSAQCITNSGDYVYTIPQKSIVSIEVFHK